MDGASVLLTALARAGISVTTKEMITRTINTWGPNFLTTRKAIRYLDSSDGFLNYLIRHVALVTRIRTLHSNESDVLMNDIYHPLTVCESGNNFSIESIHSEKSSCVCVDDNFINFNEKLTNIIGLAGQGKSTILRKAFIQHLKFMDRLPIFIELRMAEGIGVLNYINKTFINIGIKSNENVVHDILELNKIVLFLDGFDEVSHGKRAEILDEIITINTRYNINIITSSRPGTEICQISNIKNMRVKKLTRDDAIGIIKKLNKNSQILQNRDEVGLIKKINEEVKLSELMISPILVTLLFSCYPYMDIIPNNQIEFYNDLFNALYLRHDKLKNYTREKKSKISNSQAFDSFCAFSFISLQKNQVVMSERDMIDNAKTSLRNIQIEKPEEHSPEDLCEDFVDVTCLIQRDGYQLYSFIHKSICEFHAAHFIKETNSEMKPLFYEKIRNKIIANDSGVMNLISFLKCLDENDFARNITIPLLDHVGAKDWKEPTPKMVDDLIEHSLKDSSMSLEMGEGGMFIMKNIRFEVGNMWITVFDIEQEEKAFDVARIIAQILIRESMLGKIDKKTPTGDNLNLRVLINDSLMDEIRRDVSLSMKKIYSNVYIKTKELLRSSEENMLSLLEIS